MAETMEYWRLESVLKPSVSTQSFRAIFYSMREFSAGPILRSCSYPILFVLGQEGRRDSSDIAKCSQGPHLYLSYEATYTLKCSHFEKIAKNRFLRREWWKISFSRFYRKISILGYMLLHKSNINVAIANILLYRKSLYDLPRRKYKIIKNWCGRGQKGRGSSKCHIGEKFYPSQFGHLGSSRVNYVEKSSPWSSLSRIFLSYRSNFRVYVAS